MIDIDNAKEVFCDYVKNFDSNNEKVAMKISHTMRVIDLSEQIANYLNLCKTDIELAKLIALLHDIGRFEQVAKYNSFKDYKTEDHAELGVKILFTDNFIRKFIQDDKYDNTIKIAISNHNKYSIQEGLNEKELLHCKIIRDADKIDILNSMCLRKIKDIFDIDVEDLCKLKISDEVYNDFLKLKQVKYSKEVTKLDLWVATIAFIFDLNYTFSFKYIKEKDYINIFINKVKCEDKDTKERIKTIKEIANKYINEKIGG